MAPKRRRIDGHYQRTTTGLYRKMWKEEKQRARGNVKLSWKASERDVAEGWLAVVDDMQKIKRLCKGKKGKLTEKNWEKIDEMRNPFENFLYRLEKYAKRNEKKKPIHDMIGNTPWHGLIELSAHLCVDREWRAPATYAQVRDRVDHLTLHSLAIIEAMGHADMIPKSMRTIRLKPSQIGQFLFHNNRRIGHIDFSHYNLAKKKGWLNIKFSSDHNLKRGEKLVLTPLDVFKINRQVSDAIRTITFKMGLSEYHHLMRNKDRKTIRLLSEGSKKHDKNKKWARIANGLGKTPNKHTLALLVVANDPDVYEDAKTVNAALRRGKWHKDDKLNSTMNEARRKRGWKAERIARSLYTKGEIGVIFGYDQPSEDRMHYLGKALSWWPAYHKRLEGSVSDVLLGVDALDEKDSFERIRKHIGYEAYDDSIKPTHGIILDEVIKHDPGAKYRGEIIVRVRKNKDRTTNVAVHDNGLGDWNHHMSWMLGSGKSHNVVEETTKRKVTHHGDRGSTRKLFAIGRVMR